ncbi:CHAD domain-containing protein [Rhodovulum sp. YEN HP10]|uniref:CHAD domain-containing protein n=1 Tax=Rhodovulum sp. HP10 TaxID=3387397 RepID=UPI0039E1FD8F
MTYRLKRSDKTTEAALRRIAVEEIDAALAELDAPRLGLPEKVHALRKRSKKLRALIRMVRPDFPAYARENAAIRDAARRLSALRDRDSMIEAFDRLAAAGRLSDLPVGVAPLRAHLLAGRARAMARTDIEVDLAAFRETMVALRERARSWTLYGHGFRPLRRGLERTFARAKSGQRAAARSPKDAQLHDWRKRVRYHGFHTRLMRPLGPERLRRRSERIDRLSELLGEHHDLALLGAHVAASPDLPGGPELRAELGARIAARQAELAARTQKLGRKLFSQPGGTFGRLWKRRWKAWRRA